MNESQWWVHCKNESWLKRMSMIEIHEFVLYIKISISLLATEFYYHTIQNIVLYRKACFRFLAPHCLV